MRLLYDDAVEMASEAMVVVQDKARPERERGILAFASVPDVFNAAHVLKVSGLDVTVRSTPDGVQIDCDLVVEFPLVLGVFALRVLERHSLRPLGNPLLDPFFMNDADAGLPVLISTDELDHYLIVRVCGVTLVADKRTQRLVSLSGGGNPDVPYLATLLVGCSLEDAQDPCEHGFTLCSYSVQLALNEARRTLQCG